MSSHQQNASRINGAKSIGPVTAEGKARSSRNAIRHGLTGGPVVLPHESQEKYDALKTSLAQVYHVETAAEWSLLEEMAASRWRLNRIDFMETAILNGAFERLMSEAMDAGKEDVNPDAIMAQAFAYVADNSKGFQMLDRHQRTLWRSYERCVQELRVLQSLRQEVQQHRKQPAQNEPERPADYSSLRALTPAARAPEFMKAALYCLSKQNELLARPAARPSAA